MRKRPAPEGQATLFDPPPRKPPPAPTRRAAPPATDSGRVWRMPEVGGRTVAEIRLRWTKDNEQAQDLTQEFFTRLLEKDFLESYDPSRARLRTFLRVCVDRLVMNEEKAARRLKRGGDIQLSLDFESAEGELQQIEIPSPETMDNFFAREWLRSVFSLALERLRHECESRGKQIHFRLLELYDIDEGGKELTYEQVAGQFGLKPSDVTNYLSYARREFRRIVLAQLREMTASDDEFRREARAVLGLDVP